MKTSIANLGRVSALVLLASCSDAAAPQAAATITLSGTAFSPATVNVKVGQTVRWVGAGGRHDVSSGSACVADGKFHSGDAKTEGTFDFTFTAEGEYPFFCAPHCGMGMVGKVSVTK